MITAITDHYFEKGAADSYTGSKISHEFNCPQPHPPGHTGSGSAQPGRRSKRMYGYLVRLSRGLYRSR